MILPPHTTTMIKRYAEMTFAVKQLVDSQNIDEHEGISAILFEVYWGLDKISTELSKLEAEDFKRNLQEVQ